MEFSKPGTRADSQRSHVGAVYSAVVGWSANQPLPRSVRAFAYRTFARAVGVNLDEAELELAAYPSLGEFFARRLRDGARTIDPATDAVISPCDGTVAAHGEVTDGTLVQAKGRSYRLADLLADEQLAARFAGGAYLTIYLSPRDYHRVHAPVSGKLVSYDYLPGSLWPVNPHMAERRDALLARNERVVIRLDGGSLGEIAVVMVGAAGVGNIRLAHAPDSATFRGTRERRHVELGGQSVGRGDELGAFRLGSTVVLVVEPGRVSLDAETGPAVQFGQRIGKAGGARG